MSGRRGLLVVAGGYDGNGGLQLLLHGVCAAIAADEPVTILTWTPRVWPRIAVEDGLTVVRLPSLGRWDRDRGRFTGKVDTAFSALVALVAALLLRRRFRTVYGAGLVPEGIVAVTAGLLLRRRRVAGTWSTGTLGNVARLRRSRLAALEIRLLGRAHAILAESGKVAEELAEAGLPPERIRVVPSGIPLSPPRARDRSALPVALRDGHVLVAAARFDLRQKRFDVLLEGWQCAALAGWRLLLVGEGPDETRLRALAEPAGATVSFLGWQASLAPLFAAADGFALATSGEGTGLVVYEGMAQGLPGLVSAETPFDRRRPAGVTLVANDADAWADALTAFAAAPDRAEQGRAARAWVEAHGDVRATVAGYCEALFPVNGTGFASGTHVA